MNTRDREALGLLGAALVGLAVALVLVFWVGKRTENPEDGMKRRIEYLERRVEILEQSRAREN